MAVRLRPVTRRPAIGDGWYAALLPRLPGLEETWAGRLPVWLRRSGPLRGVLLALLSIRSERVVLIRHDPGWRMLLGLRAVFGRRRKLVVLHFIEPRSLRGLRGALDRWATRRALLVGQALTTAEREALAQRYELPRNRFAHVPFALRRSDEPAPRGERDLVVAAGRAECDWPTLLTAAEGAGWPLVVVCSAGDAPQVRALAGTAEVRVDVPGDEVRGLLRRAAVTVIAMRDSGAAQGHVRLADAVDAGAAIVATDVAALRGYAVHEETAVLVPEGDAPALRAAIDRLLADPAERDRLAEAAFTRAAGRTWADYLAAVEALAFSPAPARAP